MTGEETMKSILIATDGSPSAQGAVEFGVELAGELGAEVVVVEVVPAVDVVPTTALTMPAAVPHQVQARERAALEAAAALARAKGVVVRTELLTGIPIDEIVARADSTDADLIVIGSHGHGTVARTLLGSVSQGVLHESRRPVVVVRPQHPAAAPRAAAV